MWSQISIFGVFLVISGVTCLKLNYVQEYVIGDKGVERVSSRIDGVIVLKPVLIGDNFEWIVDLKNFSIHFNTTDALPDILNITCTTFVSNPLLNTLLLDEEDPSKNTCPDELKQLISTTLLKFSEKSNELDLAEHLNFSPMATLNGCQAVNEKFVKENDCFVRTTLKTSNCSAPVEEMTKTKNDLSLTRTSLFNYFKLNYTVEAVFNAEHGCDVTITSMKRLETKRFYVKNEETDNYACIRERYEVVPDEKEVERRSDQEINFEDEREKKEVHVKSDPGNEWFEMFSLINSIYSANIVYGTLSEWVFS